MIDHNGTVSHTDGLSTTERIEIVLQILSGRTSLDRAAVQCGVSSKSLGAWCQIALRGMEMALIQGKTPSHREQVLEQELDRTRDALTEAIIQKHLMKRAFEEAHPAATGLRY